VSYLSLTGRRSRGDVTIGVSSVEDLFRDIPEGVRYGGSSTSRRRSLRRAQRHLEELAGKNVVDEVHFLGAGSTTCVPAVVDAVLSAASPDGVHAVPARDEPGRPAGDLPVPDRDL
jgi:glycine dehydrogenase subunit 1